MVTFAARIWRNAGFAEAKLKCRWGIEKELTKSFLKKVLKSLGCNKKASIFALPLTNELMKKVEKFEVIVLGETS